MGPGAPPQARPIDMGLPSGLLWASCNVGAESPSDLGLYFSWGNTEGHAEGSGYAFSQAEYNTTPAANISANLSLSQDAARAYLGAPWRMPTSAEFQELFNNCTSVWTTLNGVKGRLFKSNINGNAVFFPAAGYYSGTALRYRGSFGYDWSSSYSNASTAFGLNFDSTNVNPRNGFERFRGFTVRAVMPSL